MEIGKGLGRKGLAKVALVAKPETILGWFGNWWPQKFDGSKHRSHPGRPKVGAEVEALIVQMARDNSGWGDDGIVGALAHLGHEVSDQTAGNFLCMHGIAPAPKRSQTTTWKEFICRHMDVLAGTDFLHGGGADLARLGSYYDLFFLHLETRRVSLAGITRHPTEKWMEQMARNPTMRNAEPSTASATFCMTVTRSSVRGFRSTRAKTIDSRLTVSLPT